MDVHTLKEKSPEQQNIQNNKETKIKQTIYIEQQLFTNISKYSQQQNNYFFLYGINNFIFGLTPTKHFSLKSFESLLPIGIHLNGILYIRNNNNDSENYKSEIQEQFTKYKTELNLQYMETNFVLLVVEKIENNYSFIYKKYANNSELNIDISCIPKLLSSEIFKEQYIIFKNETSFHFGNDYNNTYYTLPNDLNEFIQNDFCVYLFHNKEEIFIDNFNKLTEDNNKFIGNFIKKLDMKDDLIMNIEFGTNNGDSLRHLYFPNVNTVKSIVGKIKIENVGIIDKAKSNFTEVFIKTFNKLISSVKEFSDLFTNPSLNNLTINKIFYDPTLTAIPYILRYNMSSNNNNESLEVKCTKDNIYEKDILENNYQFEFDSIFPDKK